MINLFNIEEFKTKWINHIPYELQNEFDVDCALIVGNIKCDNCMFELIKGTEKPCINCFDNCNWKPKVFVKGKTI